MKKDPILNPKYIIYKSPIYIRENHDLNKPCPECGSATGFKIFNWGRFCDNPNCIYHKIKINKIL